MLHDSYFTLSFIARKARALRNGEYPIFVRITVSGQVAEMKKVFSNVFPCRILVRMCY